MSLSPPQVAQNVDVRATPPASISQSEAFSSFCAKISAFKTIQYQPQTMTTRGLWLLIHGECCKIRGNREVHLFFVVLVFLVSWSIWFIDLIWVHLTTWYYNTIVSVGKHNLDCKMTMDTIRIFYVIAIAMHKLLLESNSWNSCSIQLRFTRNCEGDPLWNIQEHDILGAALSLAGDLNFHTHVSCKGMEIWNLRPLIKWKLLLRFLFCCCCPWKKSCIFVCAPQCIECKTCSVCGTSDNDHQVHFQSFTCES